MHQDPMMSTSWSQGFHYEYDTSLSMESVPHESCIQAQPSGPGIGGYDFQENEFNPTHMMDSANVAYQNFGQSIEANLVYNTNTSTQFDWSMFT